MVVSFDMDNYLLYDVTLKDLKELEARLLDTASKFINNFEGYLKIKSVESLVDRHGLLSDLFEL
jgi:hypothetical protein